LDDQLSAQFTGAKNFIGDDEVISVGNRAELRGKIKGHDSARALIKLYKAG